MEKLKLKMLEISGEWNGKESGLLENRANIAEEILTKIKDIEELQEYLTVN